MFISEENKERLSLLFSQGGTIAAVLWVLKRILSVDIYGFYEYMIRNDSDKKTYPIGTNCSLMALSKIVDLTKIPKELLDQFHCQSGCSLESLLLKGGIFYALLENGQPVVQVNIYGPNSVEVDTPISMYVSVQKNSRFLGFLYTYPEFRRKGYATKLISLVMQDLIKYGVKSIVAHIRLSNIRSIRAFVKNGWTKVGIIVTSSKGSILFKTGMQQINVSLSEKKYKS